MIIEVRTYDLKSTTLADMEQRFEAVTRGIWPPGSGATGAIVKQENTLTMPASFSPIR